VQNLLSLQFASTTRPPFIINERQQIALTRQHFMLDENGLERIEKKKSNIKTPEIRDTSE
jgi:hypothetical protein